jgi:hypothetical protein
VVEAFLDRQLAAGDGAKPKRPPGLAPEEWALMVLLRERQALAGRRAA